MKIDDRIERFSKIFSEIKLSRDLPLVKEIEIAEDLGLNLNMAVNLYIYDALSFWFKGFKDKKLDENFIIRNLTSILELPNITPNGLLLPKKQTQLSYNFLQRAVIRWFEKLDLSSHITGMQTLNVRIVSGLENNWRDEREYSSKKAHTDIWGDQPANTMNFFLPICGDLVKTGVSFYGSTTFPEELIKPIDDYNLGVHLLESSEKYDVCFKEGYCLVADALSLHRTMPAGGGPRVSLEFRALVKPFVKSDIYKNSPRLNDYLPYEVWKEIGKTKLFVTSDELETFNQKYKPSETINAIEKIKDLF